MNITVNLPLAGQQVMTATELKQRLFPSGCIPLDTPDMLQRLQRRVKKLCKDAFAALWPQLVALLWPKMPQPEKPMVAEANIAPSHGERRTNRKERTARYCKVVKPAEAKPAYRKVQGKWWEDYLWWAAERRYQKMKNLPYADWWRDALEYVEWWETALAEPEDRVVEYRPRMAQPLLEVFAKPAGEAADKATAELDAMCKSEQSLKLVAPRKRSVSVSRTEMFASEDWWKTALTGFAPVSDDAHMVAYLVRHFGKNEALSILRELLPEGQASLRPPRKPRTPRVNLSAKTMSDSLKYQENRSSDVVKVEQAQTTIKACRRYFPNLGVTPKDMRSQFPLPKKKSASKSVPEVSRTATMAEKASRAAESRAAIFAD